MSDGTAVVVGGRDASGVERLAVEELERFLRRLTTQPVRRITHDANAGSPSWRVAVGRADDPVVAQLASATDQPALGEEGYRLCSLADGALLVVGGGERGVLYGVYRLLEHLGCSFHLHGDILPPPCNALPRLDIDEVRRPRFAVRGTQLWCYWYVGRDSWSFDDYRSYLDQLPKLGFNLFDFPLYLYEPMYTDYSVNGMKSGRYRLAGFDTSVVRIGAPHFEGRGRFVSPDIPDGAPDEVRNAAAVDLMRRVFSYARSRGIATCIGIELPNQLWFAQEVLHSLPEEDRYEEGQLVQPSSPSGELLARARLGAMVRAYPDVDYYAIWQPEHGAFKTTAGSPHPRDVALRERHAGPGLGPGDFDFLQWLTLAHRILAEISPTARLLTAGWGAERILSLADEVLPPDIVRSTIGNYEPQWTLDQQSLRFYEATTGDKWHTTWAEDDHRMWSIQPRTRALAALLDGLEERGVQGASILHWRNLFTDVDITFFAAACWDKELEAETHWRRWAIAKYDGGAAAAVGAAMDELEEMGAALCRDPGAPLLRVMQDCFISEILRLHEHVDAGTELSPQAFHLVTTELPPALDAAVERLERAVNLLAEGETRIESATGRERYGYLLNRVTYTAAIFRSYQPLAESLATLGAGLVDLGRGDSAAYAHSLERALDAVREVRPEAVVSLFAERTGERFGEPELGELGLLISLNEKYLGGVKRLEGALLRALGRRSDVARDPRLRLEVRCGHGQDETGSRITAGGGWRPGLDGVFSESGFTYAVASPLTVSPAVGSVGYWSAPERLSFDVGVPAGWRGVLRLHLHEKVDASRLFRTQVVIVDGERVGEYHTVCCRGEFWDEGMWVETPLPAAASTKTTAVVVELVASGRSDVRLSGFQLVSSTD